MAQTVTAYVNGPLGGKIFSVNADESSWDNVMVDTIGSNDLGQVLQGATITNISLLYTAGSAIARIQDRNTLQIKRTLTGSKAGTTDFNQTKITPYVVQPNDILVTYAQAVDGTANQTSCLAWLTMGGEKIAFGGFNIVDATATEITSLVNSQSLGTYYNQNLTGIEIMLEDGAALALVTIIDPNGGTVVTIPATTRDAGHYYFNLQASGFQMPIKKDQLSRLYALPHEVLRWVHRLTGRFVMEIPRFFNRHYISNMLQPPMAISPHQMSRPTSRRL